MILDSIDQRKRKQKLFKRSYIYRFHEYRKRKEFATYVKNNSQDDSDNLCTSLKIKKRKRLKLKTEIIEVYCVNLIQCNCFEV